MCAFGGGSSTPAPPQKVAPTPTAVQNSDIVGTSGDETAARKERMRRGYASTQTSTDRRTILGGIGSGNKTLG